MVSVFRTISHISAVWKTPTADKNPVILRSI